MSLNGSKRNVPEQTTFRTYGRAIARISTCFSLYALEVSSFVAKDVSVLIFTIKTEIWQVCVQNMDKNVSFDI